MVIVINKKKMILFLTIIILSACNTGTKNKESGVKIEKELYDDGSIKEIHSYKGKKKMDTSFYYRKDGSISALRIWNSYDKSNLLLYGKVNDLFAQGILDNDSTKIGKWKYYEDGNLAMVKEYIKLDDKPYLNQAWVFNKVGDTIPSESKYYRLALNKDTVSVGEMVKGVIFLEAGLFKEKDSHIIVCIESDDESDTNTNFGTIDQAECDTFYNLSIDVENQKWFPDIDFKKTAVFGKNYKTTGKKRIKGYLVEYYEIEPTGNDSLVKKENFTYFQKEIYVTDSL